MRLPNNPWHGGYCEEPLDGQIDVREAVDECSYRRADSIRDRRPTADHRMGIHPQLANVDLAVYGDLAVGRVVILNNPRAWVGKTAGIRKYANGPNTQKYPRILSPAGAKRREDFRTVQ